MNELNEILHKIEEERKQMLFQLAALKKTEEVKKYLLLKDKTEELYDKQKNLMKQIRLKQFSCCAHIWVTTRYNFDAEKGRTERDLGCIKCGLNQDIFNRKKHLYFLPFEEQLMGEYMKKNDYVSGIISLETCDLTLARAIYAKIKEKNPNIDDETACKYFEIALKNIRDKKTNDEKRESITKRLSLKQNFNKWYAEDVEKNKS